MPKNIISENKKGTPKESLSTPKALKKETKHPTKYIKAFLVNGDDTKVRLGFSKEGFTPEEFTSLFMGILETYTMMLLETNDRVAVFEHFNNVFGRYLNKLMPVDELYKKEVTHKNFKKVVDDTLGAEEDKKNTEDNRFAAYLLARDILVNDAKLDEETVDMLLNKKLNNVKKADA